MTNARRAFLVVTACCLAHAAVAQPPMNLRPAEVLKQADANGDGKVSRDEFIKARTAGLEAAFARMDTDGSGALDPQEVEAAAGRGGLRRPDGPRADAERPGGGAIGAEAFDRLDSDGDGRLSRAEFDAALPRMREFMQQRNGQGGGLGRPAPAGRGPDEGFRRPPQQD